MNTCSYESVCCCREPRQPKPVMHTWTICGNFVLFLDYRSGTVRQADIKYNAPAFFPRKRNSGRRPSMKSIQVAFSPPFTVYRGCHRKFCRCITPEVPPESSFLTNPFAYQFCPGRTFPITEKRRATSLTEGVFEDLFTPKTSILFLSSTTYLARVLFPGLQSFWILYSISKLAHLSHRPLHFGL